MHECHSRCHDTFIFTGGSLDCGLEPVLHLSIVLFRGSDPCSDTKHNHFFMQPVLDSEYFSV